MHATKGQNTWQNGIIYDKILNALLRNKMMKAIIRTGDGGPEVLQLADVPSPEPTETQLLVDVKATALNRADLLQRRGAYPPPPGESEILGLEIAGTVSAI